MAGFDWSSFNQPLYIYNEYSHWFKKITFYILLFQIKKKKTFFSFQLNVSFAPLQHSHIYESLDNKKNIHNKILGHICLF